MTSCPQIVNINHFVMIWVPPSPLIFPRDRTPGLWHRHSHNL
jgi:hypothetical protein